MTCENERCGREFSARPGQRFCCERCQQAQAKRRQRSRRELLHYWNVDICMVGDRPKRGRGHTRCGMDDRLITGFFEDVECLRCQEIMALRSVR